MDKCLQRLDVHFLNYTLVKQNRVREYGETPTAMDLKRKKLLRFIQERELRRGNTNEDAELVYQDEARALDRAAFSLQVSQSKGSMVSDGSKDKIATANNLDFQALTMEEVVDHTLVEFCGLYNFLSEGRFRKNHIMLQLKENLLKQMLILKAKNDHDNKGKIVELILK